MIFPRNLIEDGAIFEGDPHPVGGFIENISLVWCGWCGGGMKIPHGNSLTVPMIIHHIKSIGWVQQTKAKGWACPECTKSNDLKDDTEQ